MLKEKTIRRAFERPPVLASDRLILRAMKPSDTADMYEYAHRPDVTEFLTWEPHPEPAYTREFLEYIQEKYRNGEFFDWALILKDSRGKEGPMIGTCGFASIDFKNNSAEIGYVINPRYQGFGFATEAVLRVLDYGFEELEFNRIQARYIVGNDASRRVMDKAGLHFEGILRGSLFLRGKYRDVGVCALQWGEWSLRRQNRL